MDGTNERKHGHKMVKRNVMLETKRNEKKNTKATTESVEQTDYQGENH